MTSRITVAIARLERTVMEILRRLKQVEGRAGRALQNSFIGPADFGGGGSGGGVKIGTGSGVPARSGGTLGSATYALYDVDAGTGALVSFGSATVWNNALTSVSSGDVVVAQDGNGNYIVITEFC